MPRSEGHTAFHNPSQLPRTGWGAQGPFWFPLSASAALPAPLTRRESVLEPGWLWHVCLGVGGVSWVPPSLPGMG
jgi:hypothetical protein